MPKSVFDQELKDRAIRMYHQELAIEGQSKIGACHVVGATLGISPSMLQSWMRKVELNQAAAHSVSEGEKDRELAALRKENAQLKEANERDCCSFG
ncbi:MAG: hypothetical protein Q4D85_13640 [Corynebacterium sp.]|uniref:hypothetical protein n=1 Tax=Corynebacterium sp. TaxID=1720 RepID=UPI0026DDA50F|nr:hypothetical protein [Corynebacterium sp.]MDO5099778.1 hypothetical protein [Corynebacterium sp.]